MGIATIFATYKPYSRYPRLGCLRAYSFTPGPGYCMVSWFTPGILVYSWHPGFLQVSWFCPGILVYSKYPGLFLVSWFTPGILVLSRYSGFTQGIIVYSRYPGLLQVSCSLQVSWVTPVIPVYSWNPGMSLVSWFIIGILAYIQVSWFNSSILVYS